jgi:hypothetical protein
MAHPANTECPAVREVVRALKDAIPMLAEPGRIGTIRHDASRHTAGIAIDIMLNSRHSLEKRIADDIIAALIELHPLIRWHDILYTDWNVDGTPFHFSIPGSRVYGGTLLTKNPNNDVALGREHENHIHVDWVDFSLRRPGDRILVYDWPPDAMCHGFAEALQSRLAFTMPI